MAGSVQDPFVSRLKSASYIASSIASIFFSWQEMAVMRQYRHYIDAAVNEH